MSKPRKPVDPPNRKDRANTAVRFPNATHERLVAAAAERGLSINYLVNRAVEQFLDRLIPASEIKWTRDEGET